MSTLGVFFTLGSFSFSSKTGKARTAAYFITCDMLLLPIMMVNTIKHLSNWLRLHVIVTKGSLSHDGNLATGVYIGPLVLGQVKLSLYSQHNDLACMYCYHPPPVGRKQHRHQLILHGKQGQVLSKIGTQTVITRLPGAVPQPLH